MKEEYTVYKLFDEAGDVVWVGSTFHPINERLRQHRKYYGGMKFASHKVLGTFSSQEEAMAEEDRLLKECIDKDGQLPL